MQTSPVVLTTALVTILVLVFYFYTGVKVSQMRSKHNIHAPAVSGHPHFERAFRVQMNTLEHLPVIISLLWLTAFLFTPIPMAAPALGLVWILGRALYMDAYLKDPAKRGPGFGICALAEIVLMLLTLIGIAMGFIAAV